LKKTTKSVRIYRL